MTRLGRRPARPQAPPPPRPQSATDPTALTTTEWRAEEREKAAGRQEWGKRVALCLTLPLLAGGFFAFPLVYAWKGLCWKWPRLRVWGALLALPALAAVSLQPDAVLRPTWALVTLPLRSGAVERTVAFPYPWVSVRIVRPPDAVPGQIAVTGVDVVRSWETGTGPDPLPLLREVVLAAWPTGFVLTLALIASWGVGGMVAGTSLRSRTVGDVLKGAARMLRRGKEVIAVGLLIRGYLTLLYSPEGGGKTEWLLSMVGSTKGRWYVLTEQTDVTLAPYLRRWGLEAPGVAKRLRVVTRDDANRLWRDHGHLTEATWEYLGPMVLDDAGRWGADVFVMDTWTAWTGGTQEARGIQTAMGPLREAVGRHGYAGLVLAHTNQLGELLGSKEFRRLCDIALRMELPRGKRHPLRVFRYDKDRSGAAPVAFAVERDLTTTPPCYRSVEVPEPDADAPPQTGKTSSKIHSGPRGGVRPPAKPALREVEPDWARVRGLFPATATELAQRMDWPKRTTEYRLKRWQEQGRVVYQRTAVGRAVPGVWRLPGEKEGTA